MNTTITHRLISTLIYLLPWSDALPFGSDLFLRFPILNLLAIPTIPILILEQTIPLAGLVIFFSLYLFIVKNTNIPYSIRINTMQSILLSIIMLIINYSFQIILGPFRGSLLVNSFESTIFIMVLAVIIFAISQCIQGKEAELPGLTSAAKMQI